MDILTIFCIEIFLICVFFLIKNRITYKRRTLILNAIFLYESSLIDKGINIDLSIYERMESYNETLYRIWDFGYKNILSPEDFEKIEPFIEKAKEQINYD